MRTLRWLAVMGAALLALAGCMATVWFALPWDLPTRVAVGTAAGVIVGAVIAVWGGSAVERAEKYERIADSVANRAQTVRRAEGAVVIQAHGSADLRNAHITVAPSAPRFSRRAKVGVTMTAYHHSAPNGTWSMSDPLRHEGSLLGGQLMISPAHPYLDLVESGAELTDIHYSAWMREILPAQLDFQVVNNTGQTVTLHQARLHVERSHPHTRSIPYIRFGQIMLCDRQIDSPVNFFPGHRAATMRFHLEHPSRPGRVSSEHEWSTGTSYAFDRHPLMAAFIEAGARYQAAPQPRTKRDISRWAGMSRWEKWDGVPQCWDAGPFKDETAIMVGEIEFDEHNPSMATRRRFRASVRLSTEPPPPPPPTAGILESSATYTAPPLKSTGNDYTAEIPISHVLRPGEADRLLIWLLAEDPSVHDMQVSMLYNSGTVDCGNVHLETFHSCERPMPRPWRNLR